jgi:hypothetical protein
MNKYLKYIPFLFLCGCAGLTRDCSSCSAENFGSDWIIVQYSYDGKPINCWKENNVAITNEPNSDGIFWQHGEHLIHISGWYNRVQVFNNGFKSAAESIGIDLNKCTGGNYEAK